MYSPLLLLPCFVYHPLLLHESYHNNFFVICITLCLETAWNNSLCIDVHVLHTDELVYTKSVCVCVRVHEHAHVDMHMLHTNILVCTVTCASLQLQTLLLRLN